MLCCPLREYRQWAFFSALLADGAEWEIRTSQCWQECFYAVWTPTLRPSAGCFRAQRRFPLGYFRLRAFLSAYHTPSYLFVVYADASVILELPAQRWCRTLHHSRQQIRHPQRVRYEASTDGALLLLSPSRARQNRSSTRHISSSGRGLCGRAR